MPRILRYLAAAVLGALALVATLGTAWLAALLFQATNVTAGVVIGIAALVLAVSALLLLARLLRTGRR